MQIGASRPEMLNPAVNPQSRGMTGAPAIRTVKTEAPGQTPPPTAAAGSVDLDAFMAAWGSQDTGFDIDGSGTVDGKDLGLFLSAETAAASGDTDIEALLGAWGTADPDWDLNGDGVVDGIDLGIQLESTGDDPGGTAAIELSMEGFAEAWGSADADYDLNGDGLVDGSDLGAYLQQMEGGTDVDQSEVERFMSSWGSDDPEFDFNGDGIVDGLDLGQLLGNGDDPIARQGSQIEQRLDRMANKLATTVMSRLDLDGDGLVPVGQFGIEGIGGAKFDSDGDGFVSREELVNSLRERFEDFRDEQGLVDQGGIRDLVDGWQSRFGSGGILDNPVRNSNQRWAAGRFEPSADPGTMAVASRVEQALVAMGENGIPSNINQILDSLSIPGARHEAVLNRLLERFPIGVETTA